MSTRDTPISTHYRLTLQCDSHGGPARSLLPSLPPSLVRIAEHSAPNSPSHPRVCSPPLQFNLLPDLIKTNGSCSQAFSCNVKSKLSRSFITLHSRYQAALLTAPAPPLHSGVSGQIIGHCPGSTPLAPASHSFLLHPEQTEFSCLTSLTRVGWKWVGRGAVGGTDNRVPRVRARARAYTHTTTTSINIYAILSGVSYTHLSGILSSRTDTPLLTLPQYSE